MKVAPLRPRLPIRPQFVVSMAVALALIGAVGAAQWTSSLAREQFVSSVQQAVVNQVVALEGEQEQLRTAIAAAEAEVVAFQEQAAASSTTLADLNRRLAQARLAAGLTRLQGPGVIVEIADSQRVVPAGENPANYIVLVDDLRDLVTALWASGAEAITINGERLVATSSLYGVGQSILVNTAFLSPPFRIEAIGAEGLLDRFVLDSAYLGRVAQRIDVFGLEFATATADNLELPAFVGNTRFRWAVPSEGLD